MGQLTAQNNEKARFAQVYIMETEDGLLSLHGLALAQSLRDTVLIFFGNMLKELNAKVKVFCHAPSLHDPDISIMLRCASNVPTRTYNDSGVSEVAASIRRGTIVNAPRQMFVHLRSQIAIWLTSLFTTSFCRKEVNSVRLLTFS